MGSKKRKIKKVELIDLSSIGIDEKCNFLKAEEGNAQ